MIEQAHQAHQACDGWADGARWAYWVREPRTERDVPHAHADEYADAAADKHAPARPQGASDATSAHDAHRSLVILVADDDEPIAEIIGLVLDDAGYQPVLAANGWEALEAARMQWPALVITDLMMPRMSGLELVAELRVIAATNGHRMPPVVLLTAAILARRPEALGIAAVVSKPFDLAVLETTVRRLLGHTASE